MNSWSAKWLHSLLSRSWWVILFLLICGILYERKLKERDHLYVQLHEQLKALQQEKVQALQKQRDLQLQINSQNDFAWIELTLMKELGLVPEGQKKIYFYRDCSSNR
jgi:hypothetical protein